MTTLSLMITALDELTRAGYPVSERAAGILAARTAALADHRPAARDRLTEAITAGDAEAAAAAARIFASAKPAGTAMEVVDDVTLTALREALDVPTLFRHVAEAFNEVAARLAEALSTADPDSKPPMLAAQKVRAAWHDAPDLAAEADRRVRHLALIIASVHGRTHFSAKRAMYMVPLAVRVGDAHPRRVLEAWDKTDSRAGRWTALLATGATLGTSTAFADYKPLELPEPVRMHGKVVDPLDGEQARAEIAQYQAVTRGDYMGGTNA